MRAVAELVVVAGRCTERGFLVGDEADTDVMCAELFLEDDAGACDKEITKEILKSPKGLVFDN